MILVGVAILVVAIVASTTAVSLSDGGGSGGAARATGELGLGQRALGEVPPAFTAPSVTGAGDVSLDEKLVREGIAAARKHVRTLSG